MKRASDLGKWHHGASNALECQADLCDFYRSGLSDFAALRLARKHAAETGHTIEQERTTYRYVRPVKS